MTATDEVALLAAIRIHPEEDTPRLLYADWLDENADEIPCPRCNGTKRVYSHDYDEHAPCCDTGRVSDGRRERAEHIRWACANPQNSAVCLCGCEGRKPNPCETCALFGQDVATLPRRTDGESHYVANRGFVCEVRLSAEDWLRHADEIYWHPSQTVACEWCVNGLDKRRPEWGCMECGGSGHMPGSGTRPRPMPLAAHPITRVRLTTEPESHNNHAFFSRREHWLAGRSSRWLSMGGHLKGDPTRQWCVNPEEENPVGRALVRAEWPKIKFSFAS